jgi:tetratricopeptide (TPR) repeat protein
MKWGHSLFRGSALLLAALLLGGCLDSARKRLDEEREPHFLAGKSRVNAMDYKGAIESFQKALELNPRSAAAHFELAWLFDQKEAEPAAAIYHYGNYLKLRPNADNADTVRTRILACKQELARTVSLGPITQTMQHEFERLSDENKKLREEVQRLQGLAGRSPAGPNPGLPTPAPRMDRSPAAPPAYTDGGGAPATSALAARLSTGAPPAPRTHLVKPGETPTTIARQYGVKLDAFLRANPGLDPRRMRAGQTVNIPGS